MSKLPKIIKFMFLVPPTLRNFQKRNRKRKKDDKSKPVKSSNKVLQLHISLSAKKQSFLNFYRNEKWTP